MSDGNAHTKPHLAPEGPALVEMPLDGPFSYRQSPSRERSMEELAYLLGDAVPGILAGRTGFVHLVSIYERGEAGKDRGKESDPYIAGEFYLFGEHEELHEMVGGQVDFTGLLGTSQDGQNGRKIEDSSVKLKNICYWPFPSPVGGYTTVSFEDASLSDSYEESV